MKKLAATVALCLPLWALSQTVPTSPGPAIGNGLTGVHDQLGLQQSQEAAWQKFELAANAYITLHYQERPVLASESDAAPAQFRRLVDLHSNRLAALEDVESAVKALYATMTPAQQKLANQSLLATIPVIGGGSGPSSSEKGSKPEGRGHRGGGPGGGMGAGNMGGMGGMGR